MAAFDSCGGLGIVDGGAIVLAIALLPLKIVAVGDV
jgi:hypothetical protein